MKIILCEDEAPQAALLKKHIEEYCEENGIASRILVYAECDSLRYDLEEGLTADLVFLDIQMGDAPDAGNGSDKMNGIGLAKWMRERDLRHMICFVTAIRDHVFEGYDVDAIGYLLKPVSPDSIGLMIEKARTRIRERGAYSVIPSGKTTLKLYHGDVVGIEAAAHESIIYLKQSDTNTADSVTVNQGFNACLKALDIPSVMQIHRSYAVNITNILQVRKEECVGEGGHCFPIARGRFGEIMQAFIRSNRGEAE